MYKRQDERIYRLLCDTYGLRPEECLFIDDFQENIDGARQCGIHGIWYDYDNGMDLYLSLIHILGRTGKLTPTAVLEEVDIGGVTVKKATLNNYEDILRKKIRLGARVFIRRSNDVIPEILGTVEGQEALPQVPKPERCPACGTALEQIGPNLFCPNTLSCKPQLVARMAHFVSRDAMNIEFVSEKTIALLFSEDVYKRQAYLHPESGDELRRKLL